MPPHLVSTLLLVFCVLYTSVCRADVSSLRNNRFGRLTTGLQRQTSQSGAYPAAGYRPNRQFNLPRDSKPENDFDAAVGAEEALRPDERYGAPATSANLRLLPQQFYIAPELNNELQAGRQTSPRLSRLRVNREDQEDDDDAAAEIDEGEKVEAKNGVAARPAASVTYFPAGAVSFVQPLSAYVQSNSIDSAAYIASSRTAAAAPSNADAFGTLQAQPTPYVASPSAVPAAPAQITTAPVAANIYSGPQAQYAAYVAPSSAVAPSAAITVSRLTAAPAPASIFASLQAQPTAFFAPASQINAVAPAGTIQMAITPSDHNIFGRLQTQPSAYIAFAPPATADSSVLPAQIATVPGTNNAFAKLQAQPRPIVATANPVAQPQFYANPLLQQQVAAYSAPAQLQAW